MFLLGLHFKVFLRDVGIEIKDYTLIKFAVWRKEDRDMALHMTGRKRLPHMVSRETQLANELVAG